MVSAESRVRAQECLGVHQARGELSGLVKAAKKGRGTRVGREEQGVVLAPLDWLGTQWKQLLPAFASVPVTAARPKLGDLVDAAASGVPQVLTHHGSPAAVLGRLSPPEPTVNGGPTRRLTPLTDVFAAPARCVSFGLNCLAPAAQAVTGGRLVLIVGEPPAGGGLLASAAARTMALEQGGAVLYAASGLTRQDVATRMVAAEAGVNYQQLRAGTLPKEQQEAAREAKARLVQAPLHIDDGSGLSAEAVADTAPYVDELALIVVDRLHRHGAAHLPLSGTALPDAARTLSELAARLCVPVVAVVDTDDPDTLAPLRAEATLTVTRRGTDADVAVSERDFGLLSTVRLHADLSCARFTDPLPQPEAPPAQRVGGEEPAEEEGHVRPPTPVGAARSARAGERGVRRGENAPCENCGGLTPYRIDGRPQHMKGFCPPQTTPGSDAVPAEQPAAAAPGAAPRPGAWPAGTTPPAAAPEPTTAGESTAAEPSAGEESGGSDGLEDVRADGEMTTTDTSGDTPSEFAYGPFVVLDGRGTAHLASGSTLPCPATTVAQLVAWAADRPFGTPRLARHGRNGDPLVVLMPEAAARLGLPDAPDPASRALPAGHPVLADLAEHGWELPVRGDRPWFSAWPRIFQRVTNKRRSVQLAVVPWGALGPASAWPLPVDSTVGEVVKFLAIYSQRVMTPVSTTASTGQELMSALRPKTRAWRNETTGRVESAWVDGALHRPVDPAPCEVPSEHPLARGRDHADPAQTLMEEALQWWRMPTDAEQALPHIVALDVNVAFGAGANGTVVGTCAPYHLHDARFDKKLPGSWLYDLSGVEVDPLAPSPFTPTGARPTGPAWYETHTIAYATELGFRPGPAEAYVRPNDTQAKKMGLAPHPAPEGERMPPPPFGNGPYLKPWYEHLNRAYLATLAELGIHPDMPPQAFQAAMARLEDPDFRARHATQLQVLAAIKTTFKGAFGKLRERPHDLGRRAGDPHARWRALDRPLWRPDIRAAVISRSRVNMHRKILATAKATGAFPVAVYIDCLLFASPTPDLEWLTGHKSGFRLGPNPGFVKPEGVKSMDWYLEIARQAVNPARRINDGVDAAWDGGE